MIRSTEYCASMPPERASQEGLRLWGRYPLCYATCPVSKALSNIVGLLTGRVCRTPKIRSRGCIVLSYFILRSSVCPECAKRYRPPIRMAMVFAWPFIPQEKKRCRINPSKAHSTSPGFYIVFFFFFSTCSAFRRPYSEDSGSSLLHIAFSMPRRTVTDQSPAVC